MNQSPIDELEQVGNGALVALPFVYRVAVAALFKSLIKALRYLERKGAGNG